MYRTVLFKKWHFGMEGYPEEPVSWSPLEALKYIGCGVPQGAPTSCSTSTLALKPLERRHPSSVLYADDGLIACDDKPIITDPVVGIEENAAKSGWVKRDGKWLRPLKFLGMEYVGVNRIDPIVWL